MKLYLSSYRLGNNPEKFASMISGSKKCALIMNARDYFSESEREAGKIQQTEELAKLGINAVEIDLRNYFGKENELREKLNEFDAIWVPGGNAFLLLYVMKASGFDKITKEFLSEDKLVYGGYSAGIVVLSETLRGIEIVDDTKHVKIIYNAEADFNGLGILPYSIAPHYKSNHPESELINKVVDFFKKENIPYKTLSDGEVFIIDN